MKFLNKTVKTILSQNENLENCVLVLPGKRPVVFIKKILAEENYEGFLPEFITIEDLITEISDKVPVKGIPLWLAAYDVYSAMFGDESFNDFLKWFPTIAKDWDDILKFAPEPMSVLNYMQDEERIKNWSEKLSIPEDSARRRFVNFWQKMVKFLPELTTKLSNENLATSGMIHEFSKGKIEDFVKFNDKKYFFIGFNALTPIETMLVKTMLQFDKAQCFFHADSYYMNDKKHEAGEFLREYKNWKEFNKSRDFTWITDEFSEKKNISTYEIPGNVSQAKFLSTLLADLSQEQQSETAVILLDENLLPAALDALSNAPKLNITMGFPLKNLSFSNAIKNLFRLQKNLEKSSSYYYRDLFSVLTSLPQTPEEKHVVKLFQEFIVRRNVVYISKKMLQEHLSSLSFYKLLEKPDSAAIFLDLLVVYCFDVKFTELDDITYENISYFENAFKLIKNQTCTINFTYSFETLEVLINQIVDSEAIDFQGEPLDGLQVMGLLETRLLNFKNVILLSVNEGKLPLGNSQSTYLPFNVRKNNGMHTFLENDGIYAYHFYRLLQGAENVNLLYNSLPSGINTGEKSRFVKQIEIESPHKINHFIVENTSEPVKSELMEVEKTAFVLDQLENWTKKISVSSLNSYIRNPIDFYLSKILETAEAEDIEEEMSSRNFGNLIHFALHEIYENISGKILTAEDLNIAENQIDTAISNAILKLNHLEEFYLKGINFLHKKMAKRTIRDIIEFDKNIVENGNSLKINGLEHNFKEIPFKINDEKTIYFHGLIDRIDILNGKVRLIDYKTARPEILNVSLSEEKVEKFFFSSNRKQALQLCIYLYCVKNAEFSNHEIEAGIWSFAGVKSGIVPLNFVKGNEEMAMEAVREVILEILNPEIPFTEKIQALY